MNHTTGSRGNARTTGTVTKTFTLQVKKTGRDCSMECHGEHLHAPR